MNQEKFDLMVLLTFLHEINRKLIYGEELKGFEKHVLTSLALKYHEIHRLSDIIKQHYSTK